MAFRGRRINNDEEQPSSYYGMPESVIVDEVRATYDGAVVLANDLDLF